jgi:xanthine dehydrogenase accessory factor
MQFLNQSPTALIRIRVAQGSTPREQGAWMLVTATTVTGTIGGGRLECDAIVAARQLLVEGAASKQLDVALGPAIGQCCGGRVTLDLRAVTQGEIEELLAEQAAVVQTRPKVVIHGAGHVGRALAVALAPLPFKVVLADSRQDELARAEISGVECVLTDAPIALVDAIGPSAAHVIMTHSHALDSLIASAVMERDAFSYLGIIGSRTKRNSFRKAFKKMGFPISMIDRVICPIGGSTIRDKRPEVIAALAAAEIVEAVLD